MPTPTRYDEDNLFAKIIRGDVPCHRIAECEDTFVMLDIMPRADGHALVLPKVGSRNLLDADAGSLEACVRMAQHVARAGMAAFDADGVTLWQNNEPAGGQVIFHTHFHVIPRRLGEELRPAGVAADPAVLADHAERYRTALRG